MDEMTAITVFDGWVKSYGPGLAISIIVNIGQGVAYVVLFRVWRKDSAVQWGHVKVMSDGLNAILSDLSHIKSMRK